MNLKGRNFINTADFTIDEILGLIDLAKRIKSGEANPRLDGMILGMVFFNPSLRTRMSFASGMSRLGGVAIDLTVGQSAYTFEFDDGVVMDGATMEHIKEAVPVLARYCDVLSVRSSELITSAAQSVKVNRWEELKRDRVVGGFAKYSTVPVVNMESNVYHPCQGLGDALTLAERFEKPQGRKYVLTWAYHPKALPMATPNSEMLSACELGFDVVVCHPPEWELDDEILDVARDRAKEAGGSLEVVDDMEAAFGEASVVCAKSWGSKKYYGDWESEGRIRETLRGWIVDEKRMSLTDDAYFMHCLPVRRNVIVSDAVIDGPRSIVVDQAENRMWAQMAVLAELLGRFPPVFSRG